MNFVNRLVPPWFTGYTEEHGYILSFRFYEELAENWSYAGTSYLNLLFIYKGE